MLNNSKQKVAKPPKPSSIFMIDAFLVFGTSFALLIKQYTRNKQKVKRVKGLRKMLRQGLKRNIYWVLIIISLLLILTNISTSEASRKGRNFHQKIEQSLIDYKIVEVDGAYFDVYVNRGEKTITVKGEVGHWGGKNTVEKYFMLRSPSDYQLTFEIDVY